MARQKTKYIPTAKSGHVVSKVSAFKPLIPLTLAIGATHCHHCGGLITGGRGYDLGPGCAICGRASGHVCRECVNIPEEFERNETIR
jgi:hypothetical protein